MFGLAASLHAPTSVLRCTGGRDCLQDCCVPYRSRWLVCVCVPACVGVPCVVWCVTALWSCRGRVMQHHYCSRISRTLLLVAYPTKTAKGKPGPNLPEQNPVPCLPANQPTTAPAYTMHCHHPEDVLRWANTATADAEHFMVLNFCSDTC